MKHLIFCFFAIASCIGCGKHGPGNTTVNKTDVFFMQQASYSNLAEIDAGKIAALRGSYDSVKMFGSMMIADHSKAQSSLNALGKNLNVMLPTEPDSIHQAKSAILKTLSGHQFDTTYINGQVIDHMATVVVFQTEITGGFNVDVRNFAIKNLPMIEMHLQEALAIQSKLK